MSDGPAPGVVAGAVAPRVVEAGAVAPGVVEPGGDLLRFAAVGSVDDGKSTLIGRLLHDTSQLFDDQLAAVAAASRRRGSDQLDLSFVTDGLRAEREQGITIDVAYRYAATPRRKFVIADCPGHVQYTRNMATGASTADLALVVVDATAGLREQTRRHCCIAALLGVRHFVAAVNKMDLTGWDGAAYDRVVEELSELAARLGVRTLTAVPISALLGDNVVDRSARTPWYDGPTVLEALEAAPAGAWAQADGAGAGARLPVQWVLREPGGGRSYAGMVSGGALRSGDEVVVLPSGRTTRVVSVGTYDGELDAATASMSVSVRLEDDLDVGRGDMIAAAANPPSVLDRLEATVCWFADQPLVAGGRHRVKHTTRVTPARVEAVEARLDVATLELEPTDSLANNEIGVVRLAVATPLAADRYDDNRVTGGFVIIDEVSNATVAAGMVGAPALVAPTAQRAVDRRLLEARAYVVSVDAPLYPVSLVVEGRPCLVVGGGAVAARKVATLLACRAAVTMVAPEVHVALERLGADGSIARIDGAPLNVQMRKYVAGEAGDYRLVIAATGDPEVNARVHADAEAAGVWVNSVDDAANCTFLVPSTHRDGAVTVAVSTGGSSPALAQWVRRQVAEALGPHLGDLALILDEGRRQLHAAGRSTEDVNWRSALDGPLPGLVAAGDLDGARALVSALIESGAA